MKPDIEAGKYIIAVSGGMDSIVLLDVLFKNTGDAVNQLVIAHFDHGIRKDSATDREFVGHLAERYGLEFFYDEGRLGPGASEALARERRYEFLERIRKNQQADGIATAHHEDDLLETVIINLIRGTGRKGLSSLKSNSHLTRPLLQYKKLDILTYAKDNKLTWQEDETNQDEKYLRNYIRHNLVPKMTDGDKAKLLQISSESVERNEVIDMIIGKIFTKNDEISRSWFAGLSHKVAAEIIAYWLRTYGLRLDKDTVERLVISLKTSKQDKIIQVNKKTYFTVKKGAIRINSSLVV